MGKHPKLFTTAVNVGETLIAFNQGIGKAIGPAMAGDGQGALRMFIYGETGFDLENGQVQIQQTSYSALSKILALVWGKAAKHFTRKLRM